MNALQGKLITLKVIMLVFQSIPVLNFHCCCSYAEYMSVPEIEFLIKIPDNMSLSVAAMLPSGALWALNTVQKAESVVHRISEEKGPDGNHFVINFCFSNYSLKVLSFKECAIFWLSAPVVWLYGPCVSLDISSAKSNTVFTLPLPVFATKDFALPKSVGSKLD